MLLEISFDSETFCMKFCKMDICDKYIKDLFKTPPRRPGVYSKPDV